MKLFLDTGKPTPTKLPADMKKILNRDECHVWSLEMTLSGKLFYRVDGSFKRHYGIEKVVFLNSYVDRTMAPGCNVNADFDVYTSDGRIIEVNTWVNKLIEAALQYAPKVDPRAAVRAARRLQNAR